MMSNIIQRKILESSPQTFKGRLQLINYEPAHYIQFHGIIKQHGIEDGLNHFRKFEVSRCFLPLG